MAGLIREAAKPKSNQLNAVDLIGTKIIVKILKVEVDLSKEQNTKVFIEGLDGKKMQPMMPSKNMKWVFIEAWGDDENTYGGKYVELFRNPKVKWAGEEVGGVFISRVSHIKAPFTFIYRPSKGKMERIEIGRIDPSEFGGVAVAPAIDPAVKEAGEKAAEGGVASYVAWKDSIDPKVKETIKPYHAHWQEVAKAADAKKEQTKASEAPPL